MVITLKALISKPLQTSGKFPTRRVGAKGSSRESGRIFRIGSCDMNRSMNGANTELEQNTMTPPDKTNSSTAGISDPIFSRRRNSQNPLSRSHKFLLIPPTRASDTG
jgi:hypothetical protein